jgi:hypothetical protein
MLIAILADIHGNLPAFEAALEHVARQKVDQIVIAGDIIIGSPDSADCWQLARSLGCPIIRGNHERYAAHSGTPFASPLWSTELFGPLQWALTQLSDEDRQVMGRLPLYLRLPDAPDLFIVHASERGDHDTIESHTPEEAFREMFPSASERYIIRSHNHFGQVRLWNDRLIVTCGSVGLPLDGNPTAQYLLVERNAAGWHVRHQSIPYNHDHVIQRFYDTGYLDAAGPVGRLFFRELITATQQLVPFLRLYQKWFDVEKISVRDAVERFLTGF